MFRLNQEKMKSKGKELTNKGKDAINHLNKSISLFKWMNRRKLKSQQYFKMIREAVFISVMISILKMIFEKTISRLKYMS
jgi:hypothetical protein